MGSLGASVASLAMPETWQTAARGLESFIADPGAAATTVGQAVIDQGKSIMATAAEMASDPAGAAAKLNDDPRALGRALGQVAGDLAVAKVLKDAKGSGEGGCSFSADTLVATADDAQMIGTLHSLEKGSHALICKAQDYISTFGSCGTDFVLTLGQ